MRSFSPARATPRRGSPRLLRREDAGLAEHVAPLGQPLGGDRRDHLVDEQVDVRAPPVAVLERNLVRAHEGRRELDRVLARQRRRRRAASSAPTRSSARIRSSPRRSSCRSGASRRGGARVSAASSASLASRVAATGREDAAALGGDCGVRGAGQPTPQLVAPVAGKHHVRVRIDEAGHDRAAVGVERPRVRARACRYVPTRPPIRRRRSCPRRAATTASGSEPASACAAPRRGAGPAQVSTSDVLWIRKSASTAAIVGRAFQARQARAGVRRTPPTCARRCRVRRDAAMATRFGARVRR